MDKRQARALLELIADLYVLASAPESEPANGEEVSDDADPREPDGLAAR